MISPPTSHASALSKNKSFQEPESSYWFSDREIGTKRYSSLRYSSQDFRQELARVERRMYWLTVVSLAVAIVAVLAILGLFIQAVQ